MASEFSVQSEGLLAFGLGFIVLPYRVFTRPRVVYNRKGPMPFSLASRGQSIKAFGFEVSP